MGSREGMELAAAGPGAVAAGLLDNGRPDRARTLAADALQRAQAAQDRAAQAEALTLLACHDLDVGRFRRAAQAAERAAAHGRHLGDLAGEARATALMAQALSATGRDDDAVEAALLAVRLGELVPDGALQVPLAFTLGMACLWARSLDSAEDALQDGARVAATLPGTPWAVVPRVGLAWVELMRLVRQRYLGGQLPDATRLRRLAAEGLDGLQALPALAGWPGLRAQVQRLGQAALGVASAWAGQTPSSRVRTLVPPVDEAPSTPRHAHDQVLRLWVQAEQAWGARQWPAARRLAGQLVESAGRLEYEQLAYLGHALRGQVFRAMGRLDLALEEERAHRSREWRVQSDRVTGRQRVVQTQLDIRSSLDHLRRLALRSKELERLSLEDPLTGIANRRCLEGRLAALLSGHDVAESPVCLALIDLDDFKAVNDGHSHELGDQVLRAVALALRAAVREADLPARYGGDEFVVLFPHTRLETARQVCERIRAQVAALRWDAATTSLRVGASIGVAQAEPGDTPADLLRRADAEMFRAKGRPLAVAA